MAFPPSAVSTEPLDLVHLHPKLAKDVLNNKIMFMEKNIGESFSMVEVLVTRFLLLLFRKPKTLSQAHAGWH